MEIKNLSPSGAFLTATYNRKRKWKHSFKYKTTYSLMWALRGIGSLKTCSNLVLREKVKSISNSGKPWIHRIFPLPLGLDRAVRSGSSTAIVVTSVLDAVALGSVAHNNVIALANGAGNLPPEHLPFFEDFSQIIFWWVEFCSSLRHLLFHLLSTEWNGYPFLLHYQIIIFTHQS